HADEVPKTDTKYSPRKLTAPIFHEKPLGFSGVRAVNLRGEFLCPARGGRWTIRKHRCFILESRKPSTAPFPWVRHQLPLEVTPKMALFGPSWYLSDRQEVA